MQDAHILMRFGGINSFFIIISEVFHKVENGDCDYGVVPIENSIEGAVTNTFDLLADCDLNICAHSSMEISHNLLSKVSLDKVKKVYSKFEVFGKCSCNH